MGMYRNSKLHDYYSDWHNKHREDYLKDCWLVDIDRLWLEMGEREPVAVFDLKLEGDKITFNEKLAYKWFLKKGLPVYLITPLDYGSRTPGIAYFSSWRIEEFKTGEKRVMECVEFCRWLKSLK